MVRERIVMKGRLLSAKLMDEIKKNGFENPSPIQAQMWPVLLSGRDCIGISQTGSGKTLAFLFPAFLHIEAQEKSVAEVVALRSGNTDATRVCPAPSFSSSPRPES